MYFLLLSCKITEDVWESVKGCVMATVVIIYIIHMKEECWAPSHMIQKACYWLEITQNF